MNTICYCNTYFQLITAIQMKRTIKRKDKMYVILSDMTDGLYNIYNILKKDNFFDGVFFVKSKIPKKNKVQEIFYKVGELFLVIFDVSIKELKNLPFADEFIFFNDDISVYRTFSMVKRRCHNLKVSRFEEGILSYDTPFSKSIRDNLIYIIRRLLHKSNLFDLTEEYYCFNPEIYNGGLRVVEIPKIEISDNEIKKIMLRYFLNDQEVLVCREKYLFFPSILDLEGGAPIGELDLAVKLAEKVGIDNLIVKVHPRDSVDRFLQKGLHVDTNSFSPWEAIQLNGDFSDKIFITAISGSVLSINALLDKSPRVIFLYKMCNWKNNELAKKTVEKMENLLKRTQNSKFLNSIEIVESIDEI